MRSIAVLILAGALAGCSTLPGAVNSANRIGAATIYSGATVAQAVYDSVVATVTDVATDANAVTVTAVRQLQ